MKWLFMKENLRALQKVIAQMHKSKAQFIESIPVTETYEGRTVWQGIVYVFSLKGHQKADNCYTWLQVINGIKKTPLLYCS